MQTAMKRWGAAVAFGVAAALPAAAADVDASTVVATVGDAQITVGHLIVALSALPPQYQQLEDAVLYEGLLDQLIQQNALAQSIKNVTAATRLTIENQTSGLLAGEVLGRVAATAVTDEALQAAYDARFKDAAPETEYNAAHILVETEDQARDLRAQIDGGADFAALAREFSADSSAAGGGDLGWFTKGMMVPEFEAAAVALEPGQVAGPVQTQFGWHLVKLLGTRLKDTPTLEAMRDELAQEVERAAVMARIEEVVAAAAVTRAEVTIDPAILRDMSLVAQ